MLSNGGRALCVAALLVGGTATAAWATTGYVANPRSVVFYYGETAGNGDSQNFTGTGSVRMCANSDGASTGNTYVAQYLRNRTAFPDVVLKDASVAYNQGLYESGAFSIDTSNTYHTKSSWSAVPSAPDSYSGYVSTRYSPSSCS